VGNSSASVPERTTAEALADHRGPWEDGPAAIAPAILRNTLGCNVCTSPHRVDIEQWIGEQVPYLTICARLRERGQTLYPRSLTAHRQHAKQPLILVKIRAAEDLVLEALSELGHREDAWRYLEALNALHAIR
jgi:hypothetical protein